MGVSKVVVFEDTKAQASSKTENSRNSRGVLGDVVINNRCRTRSSFAKETAALRRSTRLSGDQSKITKRASLPSLRGKASVNDFSQNSEKDESKCPKVASRKGTKRSRSLDTKPSTKATRKSDRRSQEPKKKQKRSNSVDVKASPKIPRKTNRRSQEPKKKAAKRARSTTPATSSFLLDAHHNLALTAFDPSKFTIGLSEYDIPNIGKVLHAPEYVADIFQRLYDSEKRNSPQPYIHNQPHMKAAMRSILVDWLIEVHSKFRCEPETLHLAVNIFDRYLSIIEIRRSHIQLVGITALFIASKYEEIYPPEIKDCVCVTDRAYTKQAILDCEADILRELRFNLTVATGLPFLRRFLLITRASPTMKIAANFYLERLLLEHDALQFRPSEIAAAAVCLAINHPEIREYDGVNSKKPGVPPELIEYTGYSETEIYSIAEFVASKVSEDWKTGGNRGSLQAVQRKYSNVRFNRVSLDFECPDAIDITD